MAFLSKRSTSSVSRSSASSGYGSGLGHGRVILNYEQLTGNPSPRSKPSGPVCGALSGDEDICMRTLARYQSGYVISTYRG